MADAPQSALHAGSSLEEGIVRFLEYLDKERNCAEYTLSSYRCDLQQFARFLYPRVDNLQLPLRVVQREQVQAFVADLEEKGLKASTVARKLAALRSLFRYLCREGALVANPAGAVASPLVERALPRHLPVEQVAEAMEAPATERFSGVRDRAILEVFYGGGIRLGELVALNLSSLDLAEGTIKVMGQGSQGAHRPHWREGTRGTRSVFANVAPRVLARMRHVASRSRCPLPQWARQALEVGRTVQRIVERHLRAVSAGRFAQPRIVCATPLPPICSTLVPI